MHADAFREVAGDPVGTAGRAALLLTAALVAACPGEGDAGVARLAWHVFREPSGAFEQAAADCSLKSAGRYFIDIEELPADADQQREQLIRRLAARDASIDIAGLDVIWTAEFAEAGWILPWRDRWADRVRAGRMAATLRSATHHGSLWAAPLTTNVQLLWYRTDRVADAPLTWDALLAAAEATGVVGALQLQGQRYEGLTVLFTSLLASAGGAVLDSSGTRPSLEAAPTRRALEVMSRIGRSAAADPALASSRENESRLAFESGVPTFMINYPFVWPSAVANAPEVAASMSWARWPAVDPSRPSRVTIGGVNLGVGAFSRHPDLAFEAAACLAAEQSQRLAATRGGLPPTTAALYDDPAVRERFPFAALLREALEDAVPRPQTALYSDVSLAIARTLHPMAGIDPDRDVERLQTAVQRALDSEGLF